VPAQNPGDRCSRFTAQTTTFLHLRAKVRCRSPDSGTWYHVAAVRPSVFAGTILDRLIRSSWAATWGSGRAPRLGRVAIGACRDWGVYGLESSRGGQTGPRLPATGGKRSVPCTTHGKTSDAPRRGQDARLLRTRWVPGLSNEPVTLTAWVNRRQ
jgi:hypothetical protein